MPEGAREVVKAKSGVTPKVFVMNPDLTASFGEFSHSEMTSKNWNTIFKDAKTAVGTAVRDGSFLKAAEVVTITGSALEKWESSAGTAIEAKLVAIEDESVFVFETAAGKTIRASADQLSEASVARAKALGEK
ncbi:hypothetical protein JIN78_06455 [Roseibacillus ishigakijimensis]|uniref:Uncharacterized protein n=1 Tax=Roseibacillus ishigakijimensis TaxID=454146 RepID=A0A934RLQ3_9BACT|nr:hypothetical protein [Roseibacillus ishigakijimensis]